MARRSKQGDALLIRKELSGVVAELEKELTDFELRSSVLKTIPAFHLLRDLGSSLMSDQLSAAVARILAYLRAYPRVVLHGDELMVVSGISDWPRRVRELRVEEGWSIASGVTMKQMAEAELSGDIIVEGKSLSKMKTTEYILLNEHQDLGAAQRWRMVNSIRRSKNMSVQDKILKFLRENVGKAVTGEELRYLAKGATEWARRVRELRTQEGWPISTRTSGRPDLAVGVYVLEEDRQAAPHDRRIPDEIRVQVLERDHHACQKCGWTYAQLQPGLADPRKLLELHHKQYHVDGGLNTVENLVTLCNVDHDSIHRTNQDIDEFLRC
jgi:hypothetical protein